MSTKNSINLLLRGRTSVRPYVLACLLLAIVSLGFADLIPKTSSPDVTLVDPESTVQISTVTVTEPPIRVRLPEVIAEKDQWRGVQCAVTLPRQAVFRRADKWATFWKQGLAPFSPRLKKIPDIDFAKDMVVGVFMGEKPDPHYEIEIRSARIERRDEEPVLVVRYRNISKMEGVFTPPFAIQPFHLKRVPAFQGLIVFEEVRR